MAQSRRETRHEQRELDAREYAGLFVVQLSRLEAKGDLMNRIILPSPPLLTFESLDLRHARRAPAPAFALSESSNILPSQHTPQIRSFSIHLLHLLDNPSASTKEKAVAEKAEGKRDRKHKASGRADESVYGRIESIGDAGKLKPPVPSGKSKKAKRANFQGLEPK
ncbi:hypothetical protein E8E13_006224 [Curvularia kusanoi]|uniref:Uncharacterized protein n=1 Tax=Curvularia kusanoi TaxID=90978 RepID=A0A9P4W6G8_CURKU|nr:hypothetical protein E8E13_006224 [Curvularia kusanoi]